MFNLTLKNLIIVIAIFSLEWSMKPSNCHASNQSSSINNLNMRKPSTTDDDHAMSKGHKSTPRVASSGFFNVVNYGAKGDGKTDDTQAFLAAWENACKVMGSTILVPSPYVFLVKPITFVGYAACAPHITFQIDGNIIAPQYAEAWAASPQAWIIIEGINSITVQGKGILDAQGSIWWQQDSSGNSSDDGSPTFHDVNTKSRDWLRDGKRLAQLPSLKPNALLIAGSSDVVVTGITIKNSPYKHLKIYDCVGANIFGINVESPGNSPNTDGINLANTQHVVIHNVNLRCGDDCISILGGCSNVEIYDVNCGPGHGISIGGLGRDHMKDIVSNITVRDSIITDTLTGVRIKSFQGGSGVVQQINFTNIQVVKVENPIVIDQYYCDGKPGCKNESSAVAISGITYELIRGSFTKRPVSFECSDSIPCRGLTLSNIELHPAEGGVSKLRTPICYKAFGRVLTETTPPITCLLKE